MIMHQAPSPRQPEPTRIILPETPHQAAITQTPPEPPTLPDAHEPDEEDYDDLDDYTEI